MASSTIKLEQVVMEASSNGDIVPVLATGGAELLPALSIANAVQVAILGGGPVVQNMGWKWNAIYPESFITNSYQQDYGANNLNIGRLMRSQAIDTNNTSVPKPCIDVLVYANLVPTFRQLSGPVGMSWMYNNQLMYGVWGATAQSSTFGLTNPGANVKYTNPIGANESPSNPITQVADAFGNYWTLTTYGTCGATNPFLTNLNPVYPTLALPNQAPTQVADGTCVWTALNPNGQGYRVSPLPPQTGRVWLVNPVAQAKPIQYTSLENYLTPIPDEMYTYFVDGFIARCYLRAVDPKLRLKGADMWKVWMQSLDNCVRAGNLEPDDFRFVPERPIMAPSADGFGGPRPDYPLSGGGLPGFWY